MNAVSVDKSQQGWSLNQLLRPTVSLIIIITVNTKCLE